LKQRTADIENRTHAQLNEWDQRIDQFKNEEKRVKSRARRDEWKEAVADLEKKRDTVKNRLDDVKSGRRRYLAAGGLESRDRKE
jgi:hypothetical protein